MSECTKCGKIIRTINEIKFYLGQHLCAACFDEKQLQVDPDGYWTRRRKQQDEVDEQEAGRG